MTIALTKLMLNAPLCYVNIQLVKMTITLTNITYSKMTIQIVKITLHCVILSSYKSYYVLALFY